MAFTPKEIIVGATVPLANGSSVTLSFAGHIEREQDCDDAVLIFSRKLLKYTNSASDEDRLTARQVVSSITSTPLDKVPDVGAATPAPAPAKASTPATFDRVSPPPKQMPAPPVADAVSRQRHADKLTADLNRLQADHDARVAASKVPTAAEQAAAAVRTCIKPPAAATKSEASDPYDIVICERCGAETTKAQAKLSQLFMSKTLCKKCMDSPGGSA